MRDLLPNPTHLVDTLWPDLDAPGGYRDIAVDITVEVDPGETAFYYYASTVYFPGPHTDSLGRSRGIAYAGFQTNGHAGAHDDHVGKMAIFSIWGGTEGLPAEGGWATTFMENGTGYSVRAPYPWDEGRTYRVRIARGARDGGRRLWTATLTDLDRDRTTLIGSIAVPTGTGGIRRPITFHERYGGPSALPEQIERSVAVFADATANDGSVVSRRMEHIHVATPPRHPDLVWIEEIPHGVRSGVGPRRAGEEPG